VDKKIFIYIAICFGIFIAGALSGGVGIYIYSKRGMENLRNRVSELETYSDGILELNKRLERNRVELEGRIAEKELSEKERILLETERGLLQKEKELSSNFEILLQEQGNLIGRQNRAFVELRTSLINIELQKNIFKYITYIGIPVTIIVTAILSSVITYQILTFQLNYSF
jgi:hypothetical protein